MLPGSLTQPSKAGRGSGVVGTADGVTLEKGEEEEEEQGEQWG